MVWHRVDMQSLRVPQPAYRTVRSSYSSWYVMVGVRVRVRVKGRVRGRVRVRHRVRVRP